MYWSVGYLGKCCLNWSLSPSCTCIGTWSTVFEFFNVSSIFYCSYDINSLTLTTYLVLYCVPTLIIPFWLHLTSFSSLFCKINEEFDTYSSFVKQIVLTVFEQTNLCFMYNIISETELNCCGMWWTPIYNKQKNDFIIHIQDPVTAIINLHRTSVSNKPAVRSSPFNQKPPGPTTQLLLPSLTHVNPWTLSGTHLFYSASCVQSFADKSTYYSLSISKNKINIKIINKKQMYF